MPFTMKRGFTLARRAGIFYFTTDDKRDDLDYQPIGLIASATPIGYVRVDVVRTTDLSDALEGAKPRRGESVMNTHWLEAK